MEIVYGINPISEVLKAKRRKVLKLYAQSSNRISLLERKSGFSPLKYILKDKDFLYFLSKSKHHQGVVAEVEDYPYADIDEIISNPKKFILLLDDLTDPQNVGAILRSAYCAGVSGAILRSHHSVNINSTVCKASSGAVEHLLIALISNQSVFLNKAKEEGFLITALDIEGTSIFKEKLPLKRPIVLIVGAEGKGVKSILKRKCDILLKIPMEGKVDSLNASAASAVALFEIKRRRQW